MEVLYPRCAGLDVHQQTVVACARVASGSTVQQEVRTFGTTTGDLLALADWLTAHGCTHVAMESTGVYWKLIWHVLEGHFELILPNALQIRSVPGRKTDVNDAMGDCRLGRAWTDSQRFRAADADSRTARSDPHAEATGS